MMFSKIRSGFNKDFEIKFRGLWRDLTVKAGIMRLILRVRNNFISSLPSSDAMQSRNEDEVVNLKRGLEAVSYTHLTLPTMAVV